GKEEDPGPIELVVVGKVKSVGKDPQSYDNPWSLQVEKCLFGDPSIKAIPKVTGPYYHARPRGDGRGVFALSRKDNGHDTGWVLRHMYPVEEEKWQAALAAARFDFTVLSSTYVFAGRWQGSGPQGQETTDELSAPELPRTFAPGLPRSEGAGTLSVVRPPLAASSNTP
ncbi:MAG: hypothetical protein ABR915_23125, partial [Thermoguttaceae bacterium]